MISFNSAEKNCKVNIEIIEKNVKKLDVYLNKREKKKKVPTILVKD